MGSAAGVLDRLLVGGQPRTHHCHFRWAVTEMLLDLHGVALLPDKDSKDAKQVAIYGMKL